MTQYLTMPTLAWLAVVAFGFDGDLRIGILLVGCVPGAMASNVLTLVARGNVSYSVGLTTAATLVSPIVVPLALKATGGATIPDERLIEISINLVWMVVLPVLLGFVLCRVIPAFERAMSRIAEPLANLAILYIIAAVVGQQRGLLASAGGTGLLLKLSLALTAINVLGYVIGYLSGMMLGMPVGMRRALSIEVGMQNAGLGTSLAMTVLGNQTPATIPTALYTFGCMLTGTLLAQGFALRDRFGRPVAKEPETGGEAVSPPEIPA
jgi:BASS family bile acid:Na+ symporter